MGRTVSDAHKPGKRKTEVCADRGPAPFVRVPTNSVKWWNTSSIRRLGRAVPAGPCGPYGFGITDWSEYARGANNEIIVAVRNVYTRASRR